MRGDILAREVPDDVELQLAGLVHDVASSLDPRPDGDHALVGAALVRPLLGDRVADLVAGHVEAKRYLVTIDPDYRLVLSEEQHRDVRDAGRDDDATRSSTTFEASPLHADWTRLRRADDRAKVPGLTVPGLSDWRPLVEARRAHVSPA